MTWKHYRQLGELLPFRILSWKQAKVVLPQVELRWGLAELFWKSSLELKKQEYQEIKYPWTKACQLKKDMALLSTEYISCK